MKLFVGNLPYTTQSQDLQDLFSEFGTVTDVFIPLDRATRRPRGFAFVTFESSDAAQTALDELNGKEHEGRELRISIAQEREERPPQQQRRFNGPRQDRGGDRGGNRGYERDDRY